MRWSAILALACMVGCVDAHVDRTLYEQEVQQFRVEIKEYWFSGQDETARIHDHLSSVEAELRAADTSHLEPEQRHARATHLDRLRRYRERQVYPHNHDIPGRTPIFIDQHGTRCAMADLVEHAGGAAVVQRIARTRNFATIAELADEPELVAWLDANGLTLYEAGRIQPAYDYYSPCLESRPVDRDPDSPGIQPDLTYTLSDYSDPDAPIDYVIPLCGDADPCVRIVEDDAHCAYGGYSVQVRGAPSASRMRLRIEFLVEAAGAP